MRAGNQLFQAENRRIILVKHSLGLKIKYIFVSLTQSTLKIGTMSTKNILIKLHVCQERLNYLHARILLHAFFSSTDFSFHEFFKEFFQVVKQIGYSFVMPDLSPNFLQGLYTDNKTCHRQVMC